ncbi:MAG: aspartate/glutamate racemase family protein [Alphaproteobacteria bacterium]|nr:aspartate/glutamate racemase family protein [Alphaproteobacteria bacterium]
MKPTIGIVGGSGPLATLDIEKKILSTNQRLTKPLIDQDYFNLLVFNYSETYDRNDSVAFNRMSPLGQYISYVTAISNLNADLILLACNTAHMYLPILREKTNIPIINIMEITANYIKNKFPECSQLGLISTKVTQEKKLYHNVLIQHGIEAINIETSTQDTIMEAIYLIKAGVELSCTESCLENIHYTSNVEIERVRIIKNHPYKRVLLQEKVSNPTFAIESAIQELIKKGCRHIIFGCTELPLTIPYLKKDPDIHFIDPNAIVAEAIIETLISIEKQTQDEPIKISYDKKRYG